MRYLITIPNLLSLARILLTPLFVFFLSKGGTFIIVALIVFTIAAATDFYDGYVARKYRAKSSWGAFLDPLADKILVLTAFVAFCFFGLIHWWLVVVLVARDVLVTCFRMAMLRSGKRLVTSHLAKWKTMLQFVSIYCILLFLIIRSNWRSMIVIVRFVSDYSLIPYMMYLVVAIAIYSGVTYFIVNRAALRR